MENKAKSIVRSFLEALNKEAFKEARQYAQDHIRFIGVLGSREGADAYFTDMEKMKLKYAIQKTLAEGDEVCVQYDITMPGGITVPAIGWYSLTDGRISTFRVLFDPRPVLEAGKK